MLDRLPLLHVDTLYAEVVSHSDGWSGRVDVVADGIELADIAILFLRIVASGSYVVALLLAEDLVFGLVEKPISVGIAGFPHLIIFCRFSFAEL